MTNGVILNAYEIWKNFTIMLLWLARLIGFCLQFFLPSKFNSSGAPALEWKT